MAKHPARFSPHEIILNQFEKVRASAALRACDADGPIEMRILKRMYMLGATLRCERGRDA